MSSTLLCMISWIFCRTGKRFMFLPCRHCLSRMEKYWRKYLRCLNGPSLLSGLPSEFTPRHFLSPLRVFIYGIRFPYLHLGQRCTIQFKACFRPARPLLAQYQTVERFNNVREHSEECDSSEYSWSWTMSEGITSECNVNHKLWGWPVGEWIH